MAESERLCWHVGRVPGNNERTIWISVSIAAPIDASSTRAYDLRYQAKGDFAMALSTAFDTLVGKRLGHFQVLAHIGSGGMGEIYRARDEHLEREVVIKVLPRGALADEASRKRFRKEALALSKLNHANIATIFDFDSENGIDFLVMEYIEGDSLRAKVPVALQESEVLQLGAQIAEGLDAAHRKGVVHRDLKPSNIMITQDGRLKILDFGLAKLIHPREETASFSETHETVGTLEYMSPEQLRGQDVDARSDIYAFGVILFELATGKSPYPNSQFSALIEDILHGAPLAPNVVNPQISSGLGSIIEKCLDKLPDRRYQSAREVLVDLNRLISPSVRVTNKAGVLSRISPRAKRIAISVLTMLCAVILTLWIAGRKTALSFAPRDWILVADFVNDTGEATLDRSLNTAFTVSLEQSTYANVFPRARIKDALRRMGKQGTVAIDESVGREICVRENVRGLLTCGVSKIGSKYTISARLVDPRTGTPVRSYMENADDANHLIDALGKISRKIRRDLGESLGALQKNDKPLPLVTTASLPALKLYTDGIELWGKGKWTDAVNLFKQAVEADPEFAMAHAALGRAYFSHFWNDPKLGSVETEKALALSDRVTDRERAFLKAEYQSELRHYNEAIALLQAYLATYPDDWRVRYNFATTLRNANRHQEALEQFKEVIRIAPNDAFAYINMATTQSLLGDTPGALRSYDTAFKLEPTWVTLGNLNQEYGFALIEGGQEEKAVEVFNKAMATADLKGAAYRSFAFLAMYHGQYKSAEKNFRSAIDFHISKKEKLSEGRTLHFVAFTTRAYGEKQKTTLVLDQSLAALNAAAGNFNFKARVGVSYVRNGDIAKAAAVFTSLAREVDKQNAAQYGELRRLEGELLFAQGQKQKALNALVDAARSEDILPRASLARLRGELGQTEAAIAGWERIVNEPAKALAWEAEEPWLEGHYELAALYAGSGRVDDAAKVLDRFLQLWQQADPSLPLYQKAKKLRASIEPKLKKAA